MNLKQAFFLLQRQEFEYLAPSSDPSKPIYCQSTRFLSYILNHHKLRSQGTNTQIINQIFEKANVRIIVPLTQASIFSPP